MSLIKRLWAHLKATHRHTKRCFDVPTLDGIEAAIAEGEKGHDGQIRFVVETDLPLLMLWDGLSAKDRAVQLFSSLHIWDTEHNNGVLIYVLLAEKRVELIADRGINSAVMKRNPKAWQEICGMLELAYADADYHAGTVKAIAEVAKHLSLHSPNTAWATNELSNKPLVL